MRRSDREIKDINGLEEVIKKCKVCRVGLFDGDFPYVLPLNFGYSKTGDIFVLYFHSAVEGKKLDLIKENPHAAFEMDCAHELVSGGDDACAYSYNFASIMGNGAISIIDDVKEKELALLKIMEHMTGRSNFVFSEGDINSVAVLKIEVKGISGKLHK